MFQRIAWAFVAANLAFVPLSSHAQTVQQLTHQPPDGAWITLQLADGTVLAQSFGESTWYKLTPDNKGSYVNGTWTQVASLP